MEMVVISIAALVLIGVGITIALFGAVRAEDEEGIKQKKVTNTKGNSRTLEQVANDMRDVNKRKRDVVINQKVNQANVNKINTEDKDIIGGDKIMSSNLDIDRQEKLDDREMAIAQSLEEIINLKNKVDAIIKAQKEELFSYCSVSEESALKMRDAILEVQKALDETIKKIQE